MGKIQKPTVGRVVHYVERGSGDGVVLPGCRAAMITEVATDREVSLAVLAPTGMIFAPLCIYSEGPQHVSGGTWHWPENNC